MWHHIKANSGMGLTEQWIMRVGNAPVCSLKQGHKPDVWVASLLNLTGISCAVLHSNGSTLEQAKQEAEVALRDMGWVWAEVGGVT